MLLIVNFIVKDWAALHQERIIVYNLSKEKAVDIIKGNSIYHQYPFNEKTFKYALKPAMLGFHAKEGTTKQGNERIFIINNKRILLLGAGTIQYHSGFPVDAMVVSNECIFEPELWFKIFHPELIIIDGSLPRWKAMEWKETLILAGANVHWVQDAGAWVYPEL